MEYYVLKKGSTGDYLQTWQDVYEYVEKRDYTTIHITGSHLKYVFALKKI